MYIIDMQNITKKFPGIIANDDVTLNLKKGEIHALLGENGAGKSTLMSVLFGLYKPESGAIYKNGELVSISGPNDATRLGIGMVHQHFKLVQNFTVLENIILGVESTKLCVMRTAEARNRVLEISKQYGLDIDVDKEIQDITVGMQQRVEILKMLYRENEILIFDEPTAVLTPQEIESLMQTMKGLAAEGKSILFITHKLDEIMQVADRCTVLRKGKWIGTVDVASTTKEELSEMMVGRKVSLSLDKADAKIGDVILDVKNLTLRGEKGHKNKLTDISFNVRAGEILCVAGIDGNGQSDLVYALTGMVPILESRWRLFWRRVFGRVFSRLFWRQVFSRLFWQRVFSWSYWRQLFDKLCRKRQKTPPAKGPITLMGQDVTRAKIRKRGELGMAHIPEDRQKHGLVLDYTLAYNEILQNYYKPQFQKFGFLKKRAITEYADNLIKKFDIRAGQGCETPTRSMSGGNQQKVIVSREIDRDPHLLVAVQPTRGLDVGAIEYIHAQLLKQRDEGKAILLISLELEEVMNISDRIIVMHEGEIVANVNPNDVTFQELGLYMSGAKRQKEVA